MKSVQTAIVVSDIGGTAASLEGLVASVELIAEHVFAMTFALVRRLPQFVQLMLDGGWSFRLNSDGDALLNVVDPALGN